MSTTAWASVLIAVSEGSRDYAEAAETIRVQLQQADASIEVSVKPWSEVAQGVASQVRVVVTLGSPAYIGLADAAVTGRLGRLPVVAAMLPRNVFEAQRRRMSSPTTAVVLDQPLVRQMALLRYAFPHLRRVGVLLGPDSQQHQAGIEKAAADQTLQLGLFKVEAAAKLYPVLQRLLDESEILLVLPDAIVYNGGTIQNILLAAYRQKVPLMGFSPAYVRAGALLALYSTPPQIGVQTARIARSLLNGSALPAVQSPTDFVVEVNANVARSLGYRLSEDALRIQLLNREGL